MAQSIALPIVKMGYNVLQTCLSRYQQLSPAHSHLILRIQRVMLAVDLIALASDYNAIRYEIKMKKKSSNPQSKWWKEHLSLIGIAYGGGLVAIPLISYFLVNRIHQAALPKIDLKALIKEIRPENFPFTAEWSVPTFEKWIHGITVCRLIVNIVLTCLSSNRLIYGVSAIAQTLHLKNLSQLHWIQMQRPFEFKFSLTPFSFSSDPVKGELFLNFFVPTYNGNQASHCPSLKDHLKEGLKWMCQYMETNPPKDATAFYRFKKIESIKVAVPALKSVENCLCQAKPVLEYAHGYASEIAKKTSLWFHINWVS